MSDYNHIIIRTLATKDEEKEDIVVVTTAELRKLVGEFKITLDRMKLNKPYSPMEMYEHEEFIKYWEEDIYG